MLGNPSPFMEHEGSLPILHDPAIDTYTERVTSSLQPNSLFKIRPNLNIILTSTHKSPKLPLGESEEKRPSH